ncbi:fructosamine kinase family protein [Aurantiacibacter hainanensis]|uniref:fructosamine kinase family protein n=1 Tax=Aurantiacibacter hainanensis TaxID=3076114 RepID=UPI0030C6FC04
MNLSARIAAALGKDVREVRQLPGGDLGGAALAVLEDNREVVAKTGELVEREGAMLRAMAATGAPVPEVLHSEAGLLVMAFIENDGRAGWTDCAEALRLLHAEREGQYGWEADYAFGKVAIANAPCGNWTEFWRDRRLLPFCAEVPGPLARRIEVLAARLGDIVPQDPPPALLHGDLWTGNVLFHQGRLAALIDPACYVGDREVDLAMLQVFGSPPEAFFAANELAPGWRERVPVYQLWPMLVHLRLFGAGYRARVESLLAACGA